MIHHRSLSQNESQQRRQAKAWERYALELRKVTPPRLRNMADVTPDMAAAMQETGRTLHQASCDLETLLQADRLLAADEELAQRREADSQASAEYFATAERVHQAMALLKEEERQALAKHNAARAALRESETAAAELRRMANAQPQLFCAGTCLPRGTKASAQRERQY